MLLAALTGMTLVVTLGVGILIAGLLIVFLSTRALTGILAAVVWWIGIVLVVFGIVLVLTPVMVWLSVQIQGMLGT